MLCSSPAAATQQSPEASIECDFSQQIKRVAWAGPMYPCRFDAEDYASPLYLTEDATPSRFFGSMPKKVRRDLQEHPLAMENHGNGECLSLG